MMHSLSLFLAFFQLLQCRQYYTLKRLLPWNGRKPQLLFLPRPRTTAVSIIYPSLLQFSIPLSSPPAFSARKGNRYLFMKKQNCGKGEKRRQLANKEGRRNYVERGRKSARYAAGGRKKRRKMAERKEGKGKGLGYVRTLSVHPVRVRRCVVL